MTLEGTALYWSGFTPPPSLSPPACARERKIIWRQDVEGRGIGRGIPLFTPSPCDQGIWGSVGAKRIWCILAPPVGRWWQNFLKFSTTTSNAENYVYFNTHIHPLYCKKNAIGTRQVYYFLYRPLK